MKLMFNISKIMIHNDLPFLPERMKIEKVEKLATNLHDKLKVHIMTKFNKKNFAKAIHLYQY